MIIDSLVQDLRFTLRSLSRQRGFVVVAVLSLALGIAVNTAIFSVLNVFLLRPLPMREPDRTVFVFQATPENPDSGTSFPDYQSYRARSEVFSNVAAFSGARPMSLTDDSRRDQIYAELATASFFSIADFHLRLGHAFDPEVDRTSDPQFVAVLSHAFWQRRFASDPSIVGKAVVLNGSPFTVVGIAAEGFTGLDPGMSTDIWIPITTWAHIIGEPERLTSTEHWITTIAQLQPGVTIQQAQAAMDQQTKVRPVRQMFGDAATLDTLAIGAGAFAVGLLVLILACTNVTNLLIARAAMRQREMSVRMALGASRSQLIRLGLTESVLLSVSAAVISIVIASWILDMIVAFKPPTFIGQAEMPTLALGFKLDFRIFAFTLGLSVLCAVLVGLVTSIQATKRRFAFGFNVRSVVIALQMALSLLLLIPCGLFIRSWLNASAIGPGFPTDHVLLLPISTEQAGVRIQKPAGFDLQLADRVAALPGVEAATVMDPVPLWFGGSFAHFSIESSQTPRQPQRIGYSRVAPKYFETLRIPLLRGRDFTRSDNATAPQVAIVNETMARRFWPNGDAIGQRIQDGDAAIEIVGIAKNAKYLNLAETSTLWLYLPLAQNPTNNLSLSLALRTTGDPLQLAAHVEREVRALVPDWPAFQFRTLDEGLVLQRLVPRFSATLLGVLGMLGLILAAIGLYGVMAYVVRQRMHEIGIRLALGAPAARVVALVIRQGMAVCLIGAAVGMGLALATTRLLDSILYGVSGADPLTYLTVLSLLLAVAFLACYLPASRATKVSPLEILRHD